MNPGEVLGSWSRHATPSAKERVRLETLSALLLAKTLAAGSKYPEVRDAILGGSFAKDTWLPGLADLDIFLRMDVGTSEGRFREIGLAVGTEATKGFTAGKKYAQHPYTEATVEGVRVNIVPCYAVKEKEWKSAADRSPFHVELVRKLPDEQKAQIRILKLFMAGVGVYGAEIEVQGFSGYVAEVLIIKHADVLSVLRRFADIRPHSRDRLFTLPDPVDRGRDLAIAISREKLGTMVLAAREFLRRPETAYFGQMKVRIHPSLRRSVIAVVFSHRQLSEDILWGELRKTLRHLITHIEARGFKIARSLSASNNSTSSAFLLIPEFTNLPVLEQRVGPPVNRRKDLEAFMSSNSRSAKLLWVDAEARVRLLQQRRHTTLSKLLSEITSGKSESIGASRQVAAGMRRSARVLQGTLLVRESKSATWLERGITEIVSDAIGTRPA